MKQFFTTSRIAGLLYLGLALTGMFGFLFAQSNLFVEGNAVETMNNLVDQELLARAGIAAEVALVAFQALLAVWLYKLFRKKDSFSAGLIAVFGMVNAVAVLISAAMWLGALDAALAEQAETALTLFGLHNSIWIVANLFFGLWLIPMGYCARLSEMPRALSWFLMIGGVGYILSAFVTVIFPNQEMLAEILPMPASVGEFWMMGYLLIKQVK